MRGAIILSRNPKFFQIFRKHLEKIQGFDGACDNSIKITGSDGSYFMFYNRNDDDFFEDYEIPLTIRALGYRYGYLVECRNEIMFCDIVGSAPLDFDLLVCDNNENIFRSNELLPDKISL